MRFRPELHVRAASRRCIFLEDIEVELEVLKIPRFEDKDLRAADLRGFQSRTLRGASIQSLLEDTAA